jgi:1-phosphofructokinase family hexose kinase
MTARNLITVGLNPAIDYVVQCDGFSPGAVNTGRQLARIAAGKAANVTRALALLGEDVLALGWLGECDWPFFKEQLHKLGPGAVACNFSILAQATRQNITIMDGASETHLRLPGFAVSTAEIAALEKHLLELVQPDDAVIFSGSLPQGLTPQQFGRLLELMLARGAKVAVDTAGPALAVALAKPLWIAKPNAEELATAWSTGELNSVQEIKTAAGAQGGRVENLVVSRGKQGAVLVRADGCISGVAPDAGKVHRTVACGDHLLAGFIHSLWNGHSPADALAEGVALATARAVSADLEIFDFQKFSPLRGQVAIERV